MVLGIPPNPGSTPPGGGGKMLFGAPLNDRFDMDRLAEHPYVLSVLDRAGLTDDFVTIGLRVAETMVELFADLPPDHEFFQQYSFISAEELPDYRTEKIDPGSRFMKRLRQAIREGARQAGG